MSKIQVLPVHLVNKIAAGECIERPASVLKELVENAIDAGAGKVDIFLEQGGCKLIRITDNGGGIESADLPLAITPHATSKIHDENDLWSIATMGFRGEALASIGSVAHLKINSVVPGKDAGAAIEVNGGEVSDVFPCAGSPGTTIEVHNLFFNTPARRKFLKTPQTELGHCQEYLTRIALAYPQIGFTLVHGNRTLLQLPAGDSPRERIGAIFGPEIADGLIQVFTQRKEMTFTAYISPPAQAKPTANWQYIFVNKRCIRDRFIAHALKEAFRGLMPPDRQPVGFLFLDIDPAIVDVNVHPTKSEVRFADSGTIHSLVLGAIRDRFLSTDLTAELNMTGSFNAGTKADSSSPAKSMGEPQETSEHQQKIKDALKDFFRSSGSNQQAKITFTPPKFTDHESQKTSPAFSSSNSFSQSASPSPQTSQGPSAPSPVEVNSVSPTMIPSPAEPPQAFLQIHNSYLIVETSDGLMIIDQHALHERVLYQRLKQRVSAGPMERQHLLVPEVVNLSPAQMATLEEIRSALAKVGIEVESFGPQSIAVHSLPTLVGQLQAGDFIEDLLGRLGSEPAKIEPELVVEHVLQSLACKAAVKAGDPLSPAEIRDLLKYREEVEMTSACPHGRPTTLKMSLDDLKKQFKRT
jgi:DNA mismatch repair protein MutL